jgi:hypothetical protein
MPRLLLGFRPAWGTLNAGSFLALPSEVAGMNAGLPGPFVRTRKLHNKLNPEQ